MRKKTPEALSIPNLITYFRLLLIPLFVMAYFEQRYGAALCCLVLSGLSDVADGYIARHFDMITGLGKVIDPIADKLTQAAMFFCLAWDIPAMWILLGFLAFKECVMLTWGWIVLRRTDTVHSAKWYGKVCTAVLYTSMAALVLLPDLSKTGRDIIVVLCGSVMLMSLVLYSRWFLRLLREDPGKGLGHSLKETSVVRTSAPLAGAAMVLAVLVICAGVVALYRKTVAACLLLALAAVVFGVCLWLRKNRRPSEEEKEKEPSADEHTE